MMKAMVIQQQKLNNAFLNVVKSYLQCVLSDRGYRSVFIQLKQAVVVVV